MGFVTLNIPTIGQPNSTEAPKVDSNFVNLSNTINGGLDTTNLSSTAAIADTQLASPANGRRTTVFGTMASMANMAWTPSGTAFAMPLVGAPLASGASTALGVPSWYGDLGGLDYQVPNKTAKAVVRMTYVMNSLSPYMAIAPCLLLISSSGTGGYISYSFTVVNYSVGTATTLNAGGGAGVIESPSFNLPADSGTYALGVILTTGTGAQQTGSLVTLTSLLLTYGA